MDIQTLTFLSSSITKREELRPHLRILACGEPLLIPSFKAFQTNLLQHIPQLKSNFHDKTHRQRLGRVGNIGDWISRWLEYSFTSIVCSVIIPSHQTIITWDHYLLSHIIVQTAKLRILLLPRFRKQLLSPIIQHVCVH